jgi:ankyrin repeat protein
MIRETIQSRPEAISRLDSQLWSWLHRAVYQGQVEIVKYLLEENMKYAMSLEGVGSVGGANLKEASESSPAVVMHASRVLAVNQQDVFGRSALHVAVSYGNGTTECVEAMLTYHSKMTKYLSESMPRASPELKLLLTLDLDLVNAKGHTAALCAIRKNDSATLTLLLQAGADPNIQDDHKLGCLQMVCSRMDPATNSSNAENNAASPASSSQSPLSSGKGGSSSSSSSSKSPSPNQSQIMQKPPALIIDSPEFTKFLANQAKLLVQKGADLSLLDLHRENVLHYACRRADTELLQTLLHNGRLHQSNSLLSALRSLYRDGRLPSLISSRLEVTDLLNQAYLALIHKEVETKGAAKLTTTEVCEWLVSIGLHGSRELFLKNQVSGAFLLQMSDETIKRDLGLESLGQRTTFINRLEELKDIDKRRKQRTKSTGANPLNPFNGVAGNSNGHGQDSSSPTEDAPHGDDDDAAMLGLPNAKDYEIPIEDLNVGDVIGRGNFGEVRRGGWKDVQIAIKTIYRTGGETAKQDVYREMGILAQLRHPNILGFLGYVKHGGSVMMITDLMTGGSLHNFIKTSFDTVSRLRFKIATDIVRGMVYLHHRKLVHRDLNTKNLLLDDHYVIKISDFGLSRPKNDHKMTMSVGFLGGMAPEVYRGNDYTEKADVFSFAMVVYELVTGKESHHAQSNVMMYAHNMSSNGYRPPLDDSTTPPDWNNLIRRCWATDPQDRPSFSQLLDELHVMDQNTTKAQSTPVPISLSDSGSYTT